eukprot:1258107-Alexandrium_andersonii.AAC.1
MCIRDSAGHVPPVTPRVPRPTGSTGARGHSLGPEAQGPGRAARHSLQPLDTDTAFTDERRDR